MACIDGCVFVYVHKVSKMDFASLSKKNDGRLGGQGMIAECQPPHYYMI